MTAALLILIALAVISALAGGTLARAQWPVRAPRMAVTLWLAVCYSAVSSVILGAMAVVMPILPAVITGGLGDLLSRCAMALRINLGAMPAEILALAGMLLAAATSAAVTVSLADATRRVSQSRSVQLQRLALGASLMPADNRKDVLVLDDARLAAYCLPGPNPGVGTIVISSGALDLLTQEEVRLVLAHEQAHLRERHHLVIWLLVAMSKVLGWLPAFRLAAQEVPRLLEMVADDHAIARNGTTLQARRALAQALVAFALSRPASPHAALAMTGGSTETRVRRLLAPLAPLGAPRRLLLAATVATTFALPALVTLAPMLCAALLTVCPPMLR